MRATFHIKHPTWILCKSDYRECLIISSINRQKAKLYLIRHDSID